MQSDQLLPVLTLLLGALIGWMVKRSEVRRTEVIEAGDILSELPNYIWKQGGDASWTNLQVFLSRLRIRLRAAGVPVVIVREVQRAASQCWQGAHETEDEHGKAVVAIRTELVDALNAATDDAQLWLFGTVNLWRRHLAKKRHRQTSAGEPVSGSSGS